MKTILTTIFTIVVMAFAFNASPVMATEEEQCWWMESLKKCEKYKNRAQVDDVQDPDQAGNERDIADSGEEGSTSAAGANEQ